MGWWKAQQRGKSNPAAVPHKVTSISLFSSKFWHTQGQANQSNSNTARALLTSIQCAASLWKNWISSKMHDLWGWESALPPASLISNKQRMWGREKGAEKGSRGETDRWVIRNRTPCCTRALRSKMVPARWRARCEQSPARAAPHTLPKGGKMQGQLRKVLLNSNKLQLNHVLSQKPLDITENICFLTLHNHTASTVFQRDSQLHYPQS